MADEVMLDSWESDEAAEDWGESDESVGESDEAAEDIGERARRRGRPRSYYRRGRGVKGIALRGQDGRVRNMPFPTKLATAEETNRGLATQEAGRRALEERLDRLDTKLRVQQRQDSSVSGLVTLLIGGGLTALGIFSASKDTSGSRFSSWAENNATKIAAVTSVTQIATSGAKLAISGRYHRSSLGIAADAFATSQLAAFLIGRFHQPKQVKFFSTEAEIQKLQPQQLEANTRYIALDTHLAFEMQEDSTRQRALFRIG